MISSSLQCIIDCSGSMAEYGKPMLLVNLLRYIRQFTTQNNKNIRYFSWQRTIMEINWPNEVDIKLPDSKERSDINHFYNWCKSNSDRKILVLTDGYFELTKLTKSQRDEISQLDNLYFLGVGGDANLRQLRTLSKYYYQAEELDHVLHTIYRPDIAINSPLTQVELNIKNEPENDEW